MTGLIDQLAHPYAQRASLQLVLLALIAGAIGPWIVMRALGFFSHAIGTAAFPGLIAADALLISPQLGASTSALLVAGGAGMLGGSTRNPTRTALWLTASLATGAVIASDVTRAGTGVDAALFGSILTLSPTDCLFTGLVAAGSLGAAFIAGPRWLDAGLRGRTGRRWDSLLALTVALSAIAQLTSTGALLAPALLILPAVASRPWARSIRAWQAMTLAIGLACGFTGLVISLAFNLPTGAVIALTAGAVVVISSVGAAGRRSMPVRVAAVAAALGALAITGCVEPPKRNTIVATTPVVASLARSVAGPEATVRTLVPSGADPHGYEPRPADIEALASGRLIVANGGVDGWVSGLRDRAGGSAPLLDLGGGIPHPRPTGTGGGIDPHWFHDPRNVAGAAATLADALGKSDPDHADQYRRRAAELGRQAAALDSAARRCTARLPARERLLVTDHDAFGYLASRLGLEVAGSVLPAQSGAAAPSARDLDRLVNTIRKHRIKAIFPERALDPRLTRELAAQAGADSGAQLDGDSLGPTGSGRDSWAGMWSRNVDTIVSGLSGGTVHCDLQRRLNRNGSQR